MQNHLISFLYVTFTMVNFALWVPNMPWNGIVLSFIIIDISSPWLKNIFKWDLVNAAERPNFTVLCHNHTITRVEVYFELWVHEKPENSLFIIFSFVYDWGTFLNMIFKNIADSPSFYCFMSHQLCLKKTWNLSFQNALGWLSFTIL